jgi:hypothetical protein
MKCVFTPSLVLFSPWLTTSAVATPLRLLSFVSGKEKNVLLYTVQCVSGVPTTQYRLQLFSAAVKGKI